MDEVSYRKNHSAQASVIFETVDNSAEHSTPQQHLINRLGEAAASMGHTSTSTNSGSSTPIPFSLNVNYEGFGSDHIPFLDASKPAVLLIERDNLAYASEFGHTSQDQLENVDFDYARSVEELAFRAVLSLVLETV